MTGTIEDIIKKKYDEIEVPAKLLDLDIIIEMARKDERKFKIVTGIVLAIVVVLMSLVIHLNFKSNQISDYISQQNISHLE